MMQPGCVPLRYTLAGPGGFAKHNPPFGTAAQYFATTGAPK